MSAPAASRITVNVEIGLRSLYNIKVVGFVQIVYAVLMNEEIMLCGLHSIKQLSAGNSKNYKNARG